MKRTTGLVLVAAAASLSLTLSACSAGGAATTEPAGTSTATAAAEPRTFTIWEYENEDSAMGQAWAKAIEIFKGKHPEVTVKSEEQTFEQIQKNAKIVLTGDSVPDVMEYNKGNATAGQLAAQGLIMPLTDAAAQYGWDSKLAGSLATTAKYDENGLMGSGDWYGVPNYGEFVFLYYNADLLAEHGVEVPETLEDFEAALQTFADAGMTPLVTSAQEYPAGQLWYQLVLNDADRSFVDAYQLYDGEVDFAAPPAADGTAKLAEWVEKGYVSRSATGMTAEDAGLAFINGEAPFFYSGSWWYGRFLNDITDFELGIADFPGSTLVPGSSGNLWVVPTVTDELHTQMAAYFIDITMRPEIQAILGNAGGLPVAADPADITDENAQALIELFNEVLDRDGLAFYPDWPTATFYDDLNAGLQGLINGSLTPEQTAEQLQADYDAGTEQFR